MIILGCIADDFTGATDLANTLVRRGMRTVQLIGVPPDDLEMKDADAVVVALKSRTIPAPEAVERSLEALRWLRAAGARQAFFKYCSTFDSTAEGNIGPVADALLAALGADFAIACPAFPETGRTLFKGHLFVGDVPLNECGMQDHPLTPMTDANLVRVLQAQTESKVGLVGYGEVARGAEAIRAGIGRLQGEDCRFAIVDAIEDEHLESIGAAVADCALVTGGSGIALGLPAVYRNTGWREPHPDADSLPVVEGRSAVLAGSCSRATLGQVRSMGAHHPSFKLDPMSIAAGDDVVGEAVSLCAKHLESGPVLVYASAEPAEVERVQGELGRERAGELVEDVMAKLAVALRDLGVRKLVVAGGETAGTVVGALGVTGLRIGPQIDPGVPWTMTLDEPSMALALKSGNFGSPDFFLKALGRLK